jgi:hypothetical protein
LHGGITALAKEYNVCRQFIYTLLKTLKIGMLNLFSPIEKAVANNKKEIMSAILSYRMEGGSSIEAISTLMKRFEMGYSSVGYISQTLSSIGKLLPNTLKAKGNKRYLLTIASDEIFSKSRPILITVDAISGVILKIELSDDRSGKAWSNHFKTIEESGFKATTLASDGGTGLQFGKQEALENAIFQPDTYHAVAHRLGIFVSRFEKNAYSAIEYEYSRKDVLNSAKTEIVIAKRLKDYEDAIIATSIAIELYEDFQFLYLCIINSLKPFHNDGTIREREKAEEEIQTALELMERINNEKIAKEIKTIKGILPNLLNYFEQTKRVLKKCQELNIQKKALQTLCSAWQYGKSYVKAKVPSRRKDAKTKKDSSLEKAKLLLAENYEQLKEKVFNELDTIIQASSIVEGINSILRPYLDRSKNQVSQDFLNIFMFYHNHRRYRAGKRKSRTPMEILTGNPQEKNWMELLINQIEISEPTFFL